MLRRFLIPMLGLLCCMAVPALADSTHEFLERVIKGTATTGDPFKDCYIQLRSYAESDAEFVFLDQFAIATAVGKRLGRNAPKAKSMLKQALENNNEEARTRQLMDDVDKIIIRGDLKTCQLQVKGWAKLYEYRAYVKKKVIEAIAESTEQPPVGAPPTPAEQPVSKQPAAPTSSKGTKTIGESVEQPPKK